MKSEQFQKARKAHVFLFAAATFGFLYLRTFVLPGTPLVAYGDETIFFGHGIRVLHGQVPFRDYFTFVMPATDLFYAGAFGLLGVHAWLAQVFVIVLGCAIAAVLVWMSRKVLRGVAIFLPGLLFVVMAFDVNKDATHHWYSTLLVLAAAGVLLEGRSLRRVAAAGAVCGVAAVFTQSEGLLGLVALAVYLWWTGEGRQRVMELAALGLPFAVIVGGVLGYYVREAGFGTVYFALVTFVFRYFPAFRAHRPEAYFMQVPPHHGLADVGRFVPYVFIHVLVPFVYLYCLWRLVRERAVMERRVWERMVLINFVGLALFAAVAGAPSYHRMCMVAAPAMIVCVWLAAGRGMRCLLWGMAGVAMVVLPVQTQRHWREYLDLPTGRAAFLDQQEYEEFRWFAENTRAGEGFFNSPQISFVMGLENPTAFDYLTAVEFTRPEQVRATIEALELRRTPMVVMNTQMDESGGDNLGPLQEYLARNYRVVKVFPGLQVWERS
jgi:hypothetical protein